ncbi:MAG: RNase adapter RapZ [Magnetococcales bacterium]|nr:RNase adapter RapZ [Magnetococcales bacterium]
MNAHDRIAHMVLVTGLSGAGRSSALKYLEDLGFNWVDNLPMAKIPTYLDHLTPEERARCQRMAIGAHMRDDQECPLRFNACLERIRARVERLEILFLESDAQVLISRYRETRRRHPLATNCTVREAVTLDIERLGEVRALSDLIIDTSLLTVPQLKDRLHALFQAGGGRGDPLVFVRSFGFKHGTNTDADMVLDGRFLANPYYDPTLRPLSGLDPEVRTFLEKDGETLDFLSRLHALFDFLLPRYGREKKRYLTIDIGCTGGRHRSVYLADTLGEGLRQKGYRVLVRHRDLEGMSRRGSSAP